MRFSFTAPWLVLAALLVSACGSEKPAQPPTPDSIKAEMAEAVKPRPGLYRTTMRVTKFEIPGMPPAQAAKMQGMFSAAGQNSERCLTQAEADKGFEDFTKRLAQGDCTAQRFAVNGGNIDASFACRTGQGANATFAMTGQATAEGSNLTMKMEAKAPAGAPGGLGSMRMEMNVSSTRVGDCQG